MNESEVSEIDGDYNIITSLEGAPGLVSFDSYYYDNDLDEWTGDGLSILVKQSASQLSDFNGVYDFIDVDGYNGEITINVNTADNSMQIIHEDGTESISDLNTKAPGLWQFEHDFDENSSPELGSMMLFKNNGNEIIIIGVAEDSAAGGIFGVNNPDESHGGMIIGVKR